MVLAMHSNYNVMEVYSESRNGITIEVFLLKPFHNQKYLVLRKEKNTMKSFIFIGRKLLEDLISAFESDKEFKYDPKTINNKNEFYKENYPLFIINGIKFKDFAQNKRKG